MFRLKNWNYDLGLGDVNLLYVWLNWKTRLNVGPKVVSGISSMETFYICSCFSTLTTYSLLTAVQGINFNPKALFAMGAGYLRYWHFPIYQGFLLQAVLIFNFQFLVLVRLRGDLPALECNVLLCVQRTM